MPEVLHLKLLAVVVEQTEVEDGMRTQLSVVEETCWDPPVLVLLDDELPVEV